jgi:hypothetical protein
MIKFRNEKIALILSKEDKVISFNSEGEKLGELKGKCVVFGYDCEKIILMNLSRSKPKITLGSFDCEFNFLKTVPDFNPSQYFYGEFNLDPLYCLKTDLDNYSIFLKRMIIEPLENQCLEIWKYVFSLNEHILSIAKVHQMPFERFQKFGFGTFLHSIHEKLTYVIQIDLKNNTMEFPKKKINIITQAIKQQISA